MLQNKAVELSYQRYSRRQRQKSLIMVNVIDLALKVSDDNLFFKL